MTTSPNGKISKMIKSLANKKNRDKLNCFIVEGSRFVTEIPKSVDIILYAYSDAFVNRNPEFLFREGSEKYMFTEKAFSNFSDTVTPQGVIAVCRKLKYSDEQIFSRSKGGLLLVLDGISDPGNLGTIIRSADAAGVNGILLTEASVDIYNPKALRSTMGSVFNIPFMQGLSIERVFEKLNSRNFTAIGTSLSATMPYYDEDFNKNVAVIIGNEYRGMSDKAKARCDRLVKIPMEGNAESLNAAVAAAIVMYEALRQRNRGD